MLHSFSNNDGARPYAALILDTSGNLYGTTEYGGSSAACFSAGCGGTVFKLDPSGTLTVLHNFGDGSVANDGELPYAGLILDALGNLYGTTQYGGSSAACGSAGSGTVFKIDPSGTLSVLHSFSANDGAHPYASFVRDSSGNLYSTTYSGGSSGYGTVFEMVATPQAATQMIINQVNALSAQKVINSGQRNSLLNELQEPISLMNNGKNASAIHNLQAFVSEVEGLEHAGVLTSSQAAPLISEADSISTQLQVE